jgi:hypothetical protein
MAEEVPSFATWNQGNCEQDLFDRHKEQRGQRHPLNCDVIWAILVLSVLYAFDY